MVALILVALGLALMFTGHVLIGALLLVALIVLMIVAESAP